MIIIDKEVLIYEILGKLSIQDLIHFLSTNKELRDKYLPYFQEKIKDYEEDLRYRREVAIPLQTQNFEKLQQIAQYFRTQPLIALSDDLSGFMGLNHIPEYDNSKVYNEYLLKLWWKIYISQMIGHLVTEDELFRLNDEMADLIQVPRGTNLSFSDFLFELRDLYDYIRTARAADEYGIRNPSYFIGALVNEYSELKDLLSS